MNAFKITFEDILPLWKTELWPNRESAIEPMSVMTWPYEGDPDEYDMSIMEKFQPTFVGVEIDGKLVGVNSGHRTSDRHYRSRGIWVSPAYRELGIAQTLFNLTELQAITEGCEMLWSIPRETALSSYTRFGFETVGGFIETETSVSNVYVRTFL